MLGGKYVNLSRKIMSLNFVQELQQAFRILNQQILVTSILSVVNLVALDDSGFLKEIFGIDQWLPYFTQIQMIVNSLTIITGVMLIASIAYLMGSKRSDSYSLSGYISVIVTIIFMFPGNLLTGKINEDLIWLSFSAINLRNLLIAAVIGYLIKLIYLKLTQLINTRTWFSALMTLLVLLGLFVLTRDDWTQAVIRTLYDWIDGIQGWGILLIPLIAVLNCLLFIFGIDSLLPVSNSDFSDAAIKNLNYVLEGHSVYSIPMPINIHALFDVYATSGGIGMLLPLVIAMWIVNRQHTDIHDLKLSVVPTVFNINAPLVTTYPILFNLILLIPMIISSVVACLIPGILILLQWLPSSVYPTATSTPGPLEGFLSTNGNWVALAVGIINLVISVLIYVPFIKLSNQELQVNKHEH